MFTLFLTLSVMVPTLQQQQDITGSVSGVLQGTIRLTGPIVVPAGQTLTLTAGTEVQAATPDLSLTVEGTLLLEGTRENRITFPSTSWQGIVVKSSGRLIATNVDFSGKTCITGNPESQIELDNARLAACGTPLILANGATVSNTTILGPASSMRITGGVLRMTDTLVDYQTGGRGPDCLKLYGGGAVLRHVRLTGCHCPLHVGSAESTVDITNSILDYAAFPAMVARMQGKFAQNHLLPNAANFLQHILDIGGGSQIDLADNYWGGDFPLIVSFDQTQFRGVNDYRTEPIVGVGPRY